MEDCFKAAAKATGCTYNLAWAPTGPVEGKEIGGFMQRVLSA
jgi:hypothetical protein